MNDFIKSRIRDDATLTAIYADIGQLATELEGDKSGVYIKDNYQVLCSA